MSKSLKCCEQEYANAEQFISNIKKTIQVTRNLYSFVLEPILLCGVVLGNRLFKVCCDILKLYMLFLRALTLTRCILEVDKAVQFRMNPKWRTSPIC